MTFFVSFEFHLASNLGGEELSSHLLNSSRQKDVVGKSEWRVSVVILCSHRPSPYCQQMSRVQCPGDGPGGPADKWVTQFHCSATTPVVRRGPLHLTAELMEALRCHIYFVPLASSSLFPECLGISQEMCSVLGSYT